MRRVLFHWFGRPVYSYPTMLYLGAVLGIYVQLYAALLVGLDVAATLTVTLVLLVIALLGARLLHVIVNWRVYREHPHRVFQFSNGGASMYGGLLMAVPLSLPLLAAFGLPFGTFWDLASLTILVGMIVTRVGCFLNGCCAGRPTSGWWGVDLPNHRGVWRRRVPVQILEIAWGLVVLAGAILLWGRLFFQGALFFYVVGAYGAGRIVLESLRDEPDRILGMSVHKVISTGFVAVSLAAFAAAWLR
jgi:phosphatidylglycerol---prolipoprotein diacylglyceryl transferase